MSGPRHDPSSRTPTDETEAVADDLLTEPVGSADDLPTADDTKELAGEAQGRPTLSVEIVPDTGSSPGRPSPARAASGWSGDFDIVPPQPAPAVVQSRATPPQAELESVADSLFDAMDVDIEPDPAADGFDVDPALASGTPAERPPLGHRDLALPEDLLLTDRREEFSEFGEGEFVDRPPTDLTPAARAEVGQTNDHSPASPMADAVFTDPAFADVPFDAAPVGIEAPGASPVAPDIEFADPPSDDPNATPTDPFPVAAAAPTPAPVETPSAAAEPVTSARPAIDEPPLTEPLQASRSRWLASWDAFRAESRKLATGGAWKALSAMTAHAVRHAPFASDATLASMLLDLARIYRDRLRDDAHAEEAFLALVAVEPGSAEAWAWLVERMESRGEWSAVFDLHLRAVEATWDPQERLVRTRAAAAIAHDRMGDPGRAIVAWERLLALGDAVDECSRELMALYRSAGRWRDLAAFLDRQARAADGPHALLALRELVEIALGILDDRDGARDAIRRILALRPSDPIAVLQLVRLAVREGDGAELDRLSASDAMASGPRARVIERQHAIAEALWSAGEADRALAVADRILALDPDDRLARSRRAEVLELRERWDDLLRELETQLGRARETSARLAILRRGARVALDHALPVETTIRWLQRVVELAPDDRDAWSHLTDACAASGDHEGVARCLDARARLADDPGERVALLQQLGGHLADTIGDDARAEEVWKRILGLDATDDRIRGALTDLHRRRGDWEALDLALMRQIDIATDADRRLALCVQAAENVDTNLDDDARAITAWLRVLDADPENAHAIGRLRARGASSGARRLVWLLDERRLQLAGTGAARREVHVDAVGAETSPRETLARLERALRDDPADEGFLAPAVDRLVGENRRELAAALLERAAARAPERRVPLLRRILAIVPESDPSRRFDVLRRIALRNFPDRETLDDLTAAAEASGRADELEPLLRRAILAAGDDATRTTARDALVASLRGRGRHEDAWREATMAWVDPTHEALNSLEGLASAAGRRAELAAWHGRVAERAEGAERIAALRRRAAVLAEIGDDVGSFEQLRTIVELCPDDVGALDELESFASAADLSRRVETVLVELADASDLGRARALLARREALALSRVDGATDALWTAFLRFLLDPAGTGAIDALVDRATALGRLADVLPFIEGAVRSVPVPDPDALARVRALWRDTLDDPDHARDAASVALLHAPEDAVRAQRVRDDGLASGATEDVALTLRVAAASATDRQRRIALLREVIGLLDAAGSPAVVEIHRLLLWNHDAEVPSLRVLVDHHRARGQWRDLRDRLQRLVEVDAEGGDNLRRARLVEVARISDERLAEPAAALDAWAAVLSSGPLDDDHRATFEAHAAAISDPALRMRAIVLRLQRAEGDAATALRLELARVAHEELGDAASAVSALQAVVRDTGLRGEAADRLAALLRRQRRWDEFVAFSLERHAAADDDATRAAALDAALAVARRNGRDVGDVALERLYRLVLDARPDDVAVAQDLARLLRRTGRFDELESLLARIVTRLDDEQARIDLECERARLLARNLDRPDEAVSLWKAIARSPVDPDGALLALATHAHGTGDAAGYLTWRRLHAERLPPADAAMVFCHLAEVCDENDALQSQMAEFYRRARALDPENEPAREALRGIGRRLRSLRPAAALLPEEGERALSRDQRAVRLAALGHAAAEHALDEALGWYRRAVATDPDQPDIWEALAAVLERRGDVARALDARRQAWRAGERTRAVRADGFADEARRIHEVARAAREAGNAASWAQLVRRAWELAPEIPAISVAWAMVQLEQGDESLAAETFAQLLEDRRAELDPALLPVALRGRGLARRSAGDTAGAVADLRAAVAARPDFRDALLDLADTEHAAGMFESAIEHRVRALVRTRDPMQRARILFQLGVQWEDGLGAADEAGVCFELAEAAGLRERPLLLRVLRQFQRRGDFERGGLVIDELMQTATEPDELATLWLARGDLDATVPGLEDAAIEAYDMALSYDPARREARDGLIRVLEARGDWDSLVQILDASATSGSPEEQAQAHLRMATLHLDRLQRPDAAIDALEASLRAAPSRDALERLEALLDGRPGAAERHREVLGSLVEHGPPFYGPILRIGTQALGNEPRLAWCLLAPATILREADEPTRRAIRDMRRDHQRPPVLVATPDLRPLLAPVDPLTGLLDALGAVAVHAPASSPRAGVEFQDISPVVKTGKLFDAIARASGVSGAQIAQSTSADRPLRIVVGTDGARAVFDANVLRQAINAEVGFLLAFAVELLRPEHRAIAAMEDAEAETLIDAILAVAFDREPRDAALADRIREEVPVELLATWTAALAALADAPASALLARVRRRMVRTARHAGTLAGADLFQAFRAASHLDPGIDKPSGFGTLAAADAYIGAAEATRDIAAFAASAAFAALLRGARQVDD